VVREEDGDVLGEEVGLPGVGFGVGVALDLPNNETL